MPTDLLSCDCPAKASVVQRLVAAGLGVDADAEALQDARQDGAVLLQAVHDQGRVFYAGASRVTSAGASEAWTGPRTGGRCTAKEKRAPRPAWTAGSASTSWKRSESRIGIPSDVLE